MNNIFLCIVHHSRDLMNRIKPQSRHPPRVTAADKGCIAVNSCNPSTLQLRRKDCHGFKAGAGYTAKTFSQKTKYKTAGKKKKTFAAATIQAIEPCSAMGWCHLPSLKAGWGRRLGYYPIRRACRARGRALSGLLVRGSLSHAIFALDRSDEPGGRGASGLSAAGGGRGRHGECCPQEPAGPLLSSAVPRAAALAPGGLCGAEPSGFGGLALDVAEPPHAPTRRGDPSSAVSRPPCHSCCVWASVV